MRFCGGFRRRQQVSCPKQGHETGSTARQSVDPALLAIDHADRDSALQTGFANRIQSLDGGSAGGDDVLDEADTLTRLERSLEPVRGSVLLGFVADDQEREARGQGGRRGQDDRSQLGARNPHRFGLVLCDRRRDVLAEHGQEVRLGLEPVLVEVVARAPARTEEEVALEVGVLPDGCGELLPFHERAARSASYAGDSRRAASGEALSSVTIEPSAKYRSIRSPAPPRLA